MAYYMTHECTVLIYKNDKIGIKKCLYELAGGRCLREYMYLNSRALRFRDFKFSFLSTRCDKA